MFGLGWQEIVVILILILVLFGAKKLPEIARSLGKSVNEFKDAVGDKKKDKDEKDDNKPL